MHIYIRRKYDQLMIFLFFFIITLAYVVLYFANLYLDAAILPYFYDLSLMGNRLALGTALAIDVLFIVRLMVFLYQNSRIPALARRINEGKVNLQRVDLYKVTDAFDKNAVLALLSMMNDTKALNYLANELKVSYSKSAVQGLRISHYMVEHLKEKKCKFESFVDRKTEQISTLITSSMLNAQQYSSQAESPTCFVDPKVYERVLRSNNELTEKLAKMEEDNRKEREALDEELSDLRALRTEQNDKFERDRLSNRQLLLFLMHYRVPIQNNATRWGAFIAQHFGGSSEKYRQMISKINSADDKSANEKAQKVVDETINYLNSQN